MSDFFIVPQVQCTVLCSLESVISLYITELQTIGKHQGLQGWEIPVAIILEPEPFSAENGLLTATLKKSRPQLEKRYQMQLEQLYLTISTSPGSRCVSVFTCACIYMLQCIVVATSCVFVSVTAFRPLEQQVIDCLRHLLSSQGAAVASSSAPPPISLSLTLTQLGGDSLTASRISSLIQEAFCGDVSAQFILKHPLNDVYHLLLSQLLPSQYTR